MNGESGFSLLEVVISLCVFTFIMLIFSSSMQVSLRSGHLNSQHAQAVSLCQHKIDQMRAVGYGRVNYTELSDAGIIDDAPASPPYSFAGVDSVGAYLPDSTSTINLEQISSSVVKATVTITWKSAAFENKTSHVTLVVLITNAG